MELSPKERHALVIGIKTPGPAMHDDSETEGGDEMEEAKQAASDLRAALKGDDDQAIVEAFMHLDSCCDAIQPEGDHEDGGDEE